MKKMTMKKSATWCQRSVPAGRSVAAQVDECEGKAADDGRGDDKALIEVHLPLGPHAVNQQQHRKTNRLHHVESNVIHHFPVVTLRLLLAIVRSPPAETGLIQATNHAEFQIHYCLLGPVARSLRSRAFRPACRFPTAAPPRYPQRRSTTAALLRHNKRRSPSREGLRLAAA